MDPRLEEAAHAGDVDGLHRLLGQDRLLLHRVSIAPYPTDNPLHIAASLGHCQFAREILERNPEMARAVNGQGLTPLHLASTHGHLAVVKELLSKVGSDLCLISNKDGLLPIHTATVNDKISVLEEFMNASWESVRARTCSGDNILHLAVKFNCSAAVRFLVERLDEDVDCEFLMSKDGNGNTILHLATARKQLQMVKLLLSQKWANVNATNSKGCTVLDVLLESPCEHGDLVLGEAILAAGGRISSKRDDVVCQDQEHEDLVLGEAIHATGGRTSTKTDDVVRQDLEDHDALQLPRRKPVWRRMFAWVLKYPLVAVGLGYLAGDEDPDYDEYYERAPESLIVVATLIAGVAFQGMVNPPGGFAQLQDQGKPVVGDYPHDIYMAGTVILGYYLNNYILYDTVAFGGSLSVILLLICLVPRRKGPIKVMIWITWLSIFSLGLAFVEAIVKVSEAPMTSGIFFLGWLVVMGLFNVMLCVRFIVYVLKKIGWLKRKDTMRHQAPTDDDSKGECLLVKRIGALAAIALAIATTAAFNYFFIKATMQGEVV